MRINLTRSRVVERFSADGLVCLRTLDLNRNRVQYALSCKSIPIAKREGHGGLIYVTPEVADTLLSLTRAGLDIRLVENFVARFDPYDDNLILSPRLDGRHQ